MRSRRTAESHGDIHDFVRRSPDRAVPGEVNCCKHLFPCDDSWRLGHPAAGFLIVAEERHLSANVRLSDVPHFDAFISEYGMKSVVAA